METEVLLCKTLKNPETDGYGRALSLTPEKLNKKELVITETKKTKMKNCTQVQICTKSVQTL